MHPRLGDVALPDNILIKVSQQVANQCPTAKSKFGSGNIEISGLTFEQVGNWCPAPFGAKVEVQVRFFASCQ